MFFLYVVGIETYTLSGISDLQARGQTKDLYDLDDILSEIRNSTYMKSDVVSSSSERELASSDPSSSSSSSDTNEEIAVMKAKDKKLRENSIKQATIKAKAIENELQMSLELSLEREKALEKKLAEALKKESELTKAKSNELGMIEAQAAVKTKTIEKELQMSLELSLEREKALEKKLADTLKMESELTKVKSNQIALEIVKDTIQRLEKRSADAIVVENQLKTALSLQKSMEKELKISQNRELSLERQLLVELDLAAKAETLQKSLRSMSDRERLLDKSLKESNNRELLAQKELQTYREREAILKNVKSNELGMIEAQAAVKTKTTEKELQVSLEREKALEKKLAEALKKESELTKANEFGTIARSMSDRERLLDKSLKDSSNRELLAQKELQTYREREAMSEKKLLAAETAVSADSSFATIDKGKHLEALDRQKSLSKPMYEFNSRISTRLLSTGAAALPMVRVTAILLLAASVPSMASTLEEFIPSSSLLWPACFAINVIVQILPGRFDSKVRGSKPVIPWKTIFAPSGYAFSIWGVIYAGEALLTAAAAKLGVPSRKALRFWLMANAYQVGWCLVFRQMFIGTLWLPSVMLLAGSTCLFNVHSEMTKIIRLVSSGVTTKLVFVLFRLPLSLHASWLALAGVLNINGWLKVMKPTAFSAQLALAYASAYLSVALGAALSIATGDVFVGFTVVWALHAITLEASVSSRLDDKSAGADGFSIETRRKFSSTLSILSKSLTLLLVMVLLVQCLSLSLTSSY